MMAASALLVSILALVFSMGGSAPAGQQHQLRSVKRQLRAQKLKISNLQVSCPIPNAIDFGTWCLESAPFPIPPADKGKNNYLYATQMCAREGGWLPSAAQLIGAAKRAKLESTIDDNYVTSAADEVPEAKYGIRDRREMTSDLFTVTAGSAAAGSEGVTVGSRGNQSLGEPDPVPYPADPLPSTLNYVTIYDNHNIGGFAGGEPVGQPEIFRCAYAKGHQGKKFDQ
jgi:hypothetical protein